MALHDRHSPEWSRDLLGSMRAEDEGSARAAVVAPVSGGDAVVSQGGRGAWQDMCRLPHVISLVAFVTPLEWIFPFLI